jgi:hypothetical protein
VAELPTDEQVRAELGKPRARTLPEMMLAVLNAAERDADLVEASGQRSARQQLHDVAGGYTVYDSLRNLLEQFPTIATRGLDREWAEGER